MTGRSTDEWVAKNPDQAIPLRVRLRVFADFDGKCAETGRKITAADKWECDHRIALANGGQHRESNLQPVLSAAHKTKTAKDVAQKAKNNRVRAKHLGLTKPKRKMPYRRFDGTVVWPDKGE